MRQRRGRGKTHMAEMQCRACGTLLPKLAGTENTLVECPRCGFRPSILDGAAQVMSQPKVDLTTFQPSFSVPVLQRSDTPAPRVDPFSVPISISFEREKYRQVDLNDELLRPTSTPAGDEKLTQPTGAIRCANCGTLLPLSPGQSSSTSVCPNCAPAFDIGLRGGNLIRDDLFRSGGPDSSGARL